MTIGNNGISDHNCPDGSPHDIESSTYVDRCIKCPYEYVYPSILTARPGTKDRFEEYLAEKIRTEQAED
jgi:hypothetical protein